MEIIALLFAAFFGFSLAGAAGAVTASIALRILPGSSRTRSRLAAGASVIPLLAVLWLALCVALLPGETTFGDIDQPLPNGSRLTGIGKMPEYSSIDSRGPSIESLDVNGPIVAAKVCESCDKAFTAEARGPYLLIDTKTKSTAYYPTLESLQPAFGRPVHLVETQTFRSQEPEYLRQRSRNRIIMFTPPIVLTLAYFVFLLRRRQESFASRGNLY